MGAHVPELQTDLRKKSEKHSKTRKQHRRLAIFPMGFSPVLTGLHPLRGGIQDLDSNPSKGIPSRTPGCSSECHVPLNALH